MRPRSTTTFIWKTLLFSFLQTVTTRTLRLLFHVFRTKRPHWLRQACGSQPKKLKCVLRSGKSLKIWHHLTRNVSCPANDLQRNDQAQPTFDVVQAVPLIERKPNASGTNALGIRKLSVYWSCQQKNQLPLFALPMSFRKRSQKCHQLSHDADFFFTKNLCLSRRHKSWKRQTFYGKRFPTLFIKSNVSNCGTSPWGHVLLIFRFVDFLFFFNIFYCHFITLTTEKTKMKDFERLNNRSRRDSGTSCCSTWTWFAAASDSTRSLGPRLVCVKNQIQLADLWLIPGVSNIRPAGQNRPVPRLNPARGMIL